ncbi:signal peptidase I [Anaerococcus porci]|uniref:signal peptidase I n=1 Tax=Anaerococcus porci TaxID=2652269 RepID=UPI002A75FADC|nr:signal peptidase I [Anaerococcus porci]MDY3006966.1 signal peptidase I [Anaerococcus porci]
MSEENSLEFLDWIKTILLALILAFFIKIFLLDATKVEGNSMLNTLHSGDMLFVDKLSKHFKGFDVGDIVIIEAPDQESTLYIKRIVGLPGDTVYISNGNVYINGEIYSEHYINTNETLTTNNNSEWTLNEGEYFVMGDNRLPNASNDSRNFGPISENSIVGHAFLRFYPLYDIGFVDKENR